MLAYNTNANAITACLIVDGTQWFKGKEGATIWGYAIRPKRCASMLRAKTRTNWKIWGRLFDCSLATMTKYLYM